MTKKKRVMVAMSGGVDSAVAAALLKKRGYEVIGVTMCFSAYSGSASDGNLLDKDRKRPSCCDLSGIEDARKIAHILGIRHYVLNFSRLLKEKVIKNFCREYMDGRTPNPCVRCNQFLKFEALFKKAKEISCAYLATGHYAKIVYSNRKRKYLLKRGVDKKKDQSYFLYSIKKDILPYLFFPLGDYRKEQVRSIARNFKLPVSNKPASQEICFVPTKDYRIFLTEHIKTGIRPGPLMHIDGRVLGKHRGIPFYTIGQRKALGGGNRTPLYVIKIDRAKNTIILGERKYTYSQGLIASHLNFLSIDNLKKTIALRVKIRYNHQEVKARLIPINRGSIRIEFSLSQLAVTPGQSVVFYDQDVVVGGGIITESLLSEDGKGYCNRNREIKKRKKCDNISS